MRNAVLKFADSDQVVLANSTGSTITAGSVVRVGESNLFGIALADIANNASGVVVIGGTFRFNKPTGGGTNYAVGRALGWDAANNRVTTSLEDGAICRVLEQPGTSDTTVVGIINPTPRTRRGRVLGTDSRVASNVFTLPLGFTPAHVDGYVRAADGTVKSGGTVNLSGQTLTIGATAIAGTDVVGFDAAEF
jgi:hypothetical protein